MIIYQCDLCRKEVKGIDDLKSIYVSTYMNDPKKPTTLTIENGVCGQCRKIVCSNLKEVITALIKSKR